MKLTVIGFWGGYPAPNGASSLYIIEKDDITVALDFGSGGLLKLQQYMLVTKLDAVILSHYHADHIADIGVLQHALLVDSYITGHTKKLPIYGHKEDELQFSLLDSDYTEGIAYDPQAELTIGTLSIQFLKTNHSVPCYGMRITDGQSTIIYTADTAYQSSWLDFSENANLLLADCNFYADQDGQAAGHMTSKDAAFIAQQANVDTLVLSHLPQYGDHQQLVQEARNVFSGTVKLAYEGMTWKNCI